MKEKNPFWLPTEQQQFRIRLAFQYKEVEEHKYYLSERKGFDVGMNHSAVDWVSSGHAERFATDFSKAQNGIYAYCARHCEDKRCDTTCALSLHEIHNLMGD